ncbi:MAG: S46 family peptidase, partial [Steroidobacteraceae bacterium]
MPRWVRGAAFAATLFLTFASARADEGMWTVDHFPSSEVKARYGFAPPVQWLEHVRDSAVRLTSGCSASLVSKDGLILTNHHCVVDCVQTMSTKEHDFVADGYVANTRADEKPCPGMQAEILTDIRDVTPTVLAAMKAADPKDAIKARDAAYA